jgi:aminobenzoyl-glutamate utilization protein B
MKLLSVFVLPASLCVLAVPAPSALRAQAVPAPDARRLDALKSAVSADVDSKQKLTQVIVDTIFSYGELGFQEIETSRYLTTLLRKEGFTIEEGIAGVPTAWMASWGSGKPVIALGSDIDCIPQASQKPGVAYHDPIIDGAPGHGEGHNAGQAVNIVAALAVKRIMEREKIPGTLRLWPGVAEELLATKAYLVRDGYFKDVDAVLFTHVGNMLNVSWGTTRYTGMVSVEYTFSGQAAHSAVAPWRGRSALDAVELMDIGWNFRREHLRLQERSHYVIPNGGDQPNVVPPVASVWYYFREMDYPHITELWAIGREMAKGAALMTNTTYSERVLGSAWPVHFNKAIAETADANIRRVGLPQWTDADQTLARALQKELNVPARGLATELEPMLGPIPEAERMGYGSDDIGDVSWTVPTIMLGFPSNIPDLPGHHWANAISMATPIAHKGATAGAKVLAMTMVELLLRPEVLRDAWTYFRDVQTKDVKYQPLVAPTDKPAIFLNEKKMAQYRDQMKKYYYDPSKYSTYLEQLGIKYPTVRSPQQ